MFDLTAESVDAAQRPLRERSLGSSVTAILAHLVGVMARQDTINDDLREFNRQQGTINARLTAAIERLDVTQARIETLLARMIPQGENRREA